MASWTPSSLSSASVTTVPCDCSMTTLSVISRHSDSAFTPLSSITPEIISTMSGCANWRAERLTHMPAGGGRPPPPHPRLPPPPPHPPSPRLPRGLGQRPAPDRHDQPAVLRHRYEVVGHEPPAGRVLPAQQRL